MYDGLEVFWQYVGHGDCTLLRRWKNDVPQNVLIDGGIKGQYEERVKPLLVSLDIKHLDGILNTHPDRDHIGGLIKLAGDSDFTIGEAWVHRPGFHRGAQDAASIQKAHQFTTNKELKFIMASLQDEEDLEEILDRNGVPIFEPFQGSTIQDFLHVWGPTVDYYESLVPHFASTPGVKEEASLDCEIKKAESISFLHMGALDDLEEQPTTTPSNNASAITFTEFEDSTFLFTGDAGVDALTQALNYGQRSGFRWLQAPHHGSRGNMTHALLDRIKPKKIAYSAAPDLAHHPHPAVRRAAKRRGIRQFATWHEKNGTKRSSAGKVPDWGGGPWKEFD